MTVKQTLLAARELLTPEGAWTQGSYARDASGRRTGCWEPNAVCWCLEGAIKRVSNTDEEYSEALSLLAHEVRLVHRWNDHPDRKPQDVLQLLDNLISRLP